MTPHPITLRRLQLRNFKGFARLSVGFRKTSVLVGPNSAGKSTVIEAVSAVAQMLAYAKRNGPEYVSETAWSGWAYRFHREDFLAEDDNLRHNFQEDSEVRIEATFGSRARLTAIWPSGDDESPYFFLVGPDGLTPRTALQVRQDFPSIGVIPPLSPLEHQEDLLTPKYIQEMVGTKLASRHFRNHLLRLQDVGDDSFSRLIAEYSPELEFTNVDTVIQPKKSRLDAYYREAGERQPKELCWAGDGVQIWFQILYHLGRLADCSLIVLDEPDVYLHADLQRRLVMLLQNSEFQSIFATHSYEVMTQADMDQLVWVDRKANRAITLPESRRVAEFAQITGTAFNMGLAKALRARAILFVEGEDKKVLSQLAGTLGARHVAQERSLAIVPLGGSGNWSRLVSFGWLAKRFLSDSVKGTLILDRDFHSDEFIAKVVNELESDGSMKVRFWDRHELESYLIVPSAIHRLTGLPESEVLALLREVTELKRSEWVDSARVMVAEDENIKSLDKALKRGTAWVDEWWGSIDARLERVPGKELLAGLNDLLQARRIRAVTIPVLARTLLAEEIDPEVRRLFAELERQAAS